MVQGRSVTGIAAMIHLHGALDETREVLEVEDECDPWIAALADISDRVTNTIGRALPADDLIPSGLIFKVEDA